MTSHNTLSINLITNYFCKTLLLFAAVFLFSHGNLAAECCAKIEAGPAFLHIDVLESGRTIKKLNMTALKADASFIIWKGVCLKPTILYARQGHSEIASGGCGIGHYCPINKKFSVTPSIGCNFTQFKTNIHIPITEFFKLQLREKFHSISPYVSLDASYCFAEGWRVIGIYQYVWSRTWTKIKDFPTDKSRPKGSNYALVLERDLNCNWSVNIGAAYNESLTKEKHGLRGYGVRLAFAYWF